MEYLDMFWTFLTTFAYWPQVLFVTGGIFAGYLFGMLTLHLRRRHGQHRRTSYDGRSMVLIEPKERGSKRKKNPSAEYFHFINTAQYGQNNVTEVQKKPSKTSLLERD